ncbi:MAG: OmpH family outer membrane protein [Rikenellaceae bacterium]|nr:OmpH family outer membrane protein [Rikenellaceae bacterium]MBQ7342289.1 OmpH family outer membrane protein [Alistipes sp.]
MKKIFLVALAAAAMMTSCKEAEQNKAEEQTAQATEVVGDIAFVNTDKVFAESEIFKTEGAALKEKTEKAQQSWANKEQSLQNEAVQLQEKYQKGLITTRDAQAKQESIEKRAAALQERVQKEAQTLEEENFVFTNRMQDLLIRAVQAVNADKQYKMVLNASALLDADMALDITDAVLAKYNELYAAEKKEK